MNTKTLLIMLVAILCATHNAGALPETSASLTIEGVASHPVMALTPADIAHGRQNYAKYDWARQIGDKITSAAEVWLERDPDWIARHMPGQNACFAYGFAGCPECGGKTGMWINSDCSFDNPGHVKCENGHTLPNEKYPDVGDGYTGADGRIHYFVGTYNSWAVEMFIRGAYDLAYAYSITGKAEYAARAVQILDGVAEIYPTCTLGSWDYPAPEVRLNTGRLNRPQYQVGRVLILLADAYDQVFHSPELEKLSFVNGLTRRENIEQNMLLDGAWYCFERSQIFNGLHNGEADYLKGSLVVGLVLGIPEYVHWAVDGPYGIRSMLANNIGRDGTYYETATGYSNYTRAIYRGYAEYLLHYRGSAYPDGVNLYEDDRFRNFMTLLNLKIQIGGREASYGDAAPALSFTPPARPFDVYDFECLEYLKARAASPADRQMYSDAIAWMTEGDPTRHYPDNPSARWLLFHADPETSRSGVSETNALVQRVQSADLLGQKGMAMLRSGSGKDAHGVMLRYGPSLNHGNFDDLNFAYYALGHDLTYDLGYSLGSAHVYSGWSKHTASHQLVVVDEKSQGEGGAPTGGSLRGLWQGKHTSAVRASVPIAYSNLGVSEYERTLFLVGNPETMATYMVDIFRVDGGTQHDSFTHSLGRDMTFGNATAAEPTSASLAGRDYMWGDKVLVDGDVAGHPGKPYWLAPPGNGYGFLMEPQSLTPNEKSWWAEWKLDDKASVRTWFPAMDRGRHGQSETALSAWAPGILQPLPDAAHIIRRRNAGEVPSIFITVWEPHTGNPQIVGIEQQGVDDGKAVAVTVTLRDGSTEILYVGDAGLESSVSDIEVAATVARFTLDDGVVKLAEGLGVESLSIDKQEKLDGHIGRFSGSIENVDLRNSRVITDTTFPADANITGLIMTFDNPAYSRSTSYRVASVQAFTTGSIIQLTEQSILGRGIVSEVDATSNTITTVIPHEYVKPVHRNGESEYFKGKRLSAEDTSARIKSIALGQPQVIELDSTAGFEVGDEFFYEDIQPGDTWEILVPVTIR